MSAASIALQAQARLIEARRAEQIAELKRHADACIYCGEGPTEQRDLRAITVGPWDDLQPICERCFAARGEETNFTDHPMLWRAMPEANR